MLGVGKCWEILLESDGNTPFIPICRAEPGPKCFVPKSSAEMMSPYFWVTAMTVVPEKLMSYAILSSCGCPCLNLVDAVIGHSFFSCPLSFPFTATPPASDTLLFQQHCCFSVHVAQPPPGFVPLPQEAEGESFHVHPSNPLHLNLFARKSLFCTYLYLSQSEKGCTLGIA